MKNTVNIIEIIATYVSSIQKKDFFEQLMINSFEKEYPKFLSNLIEYFLVDCLYFFCYI